jgi:hypothetical protein
MAKHGLPPRESEIMACLIMRMQGNRSGLSVFSELVRYAGQPTIKEGRQTRQGKSVSYIGDG